MSEKGSYSTPQEGRLKALDREWPLHPSQQQSAAERFPRQPSAATAGEVSSDPNAVFRAWFTLSHLLPDPGARIADFGCGDGAMTYAMAAAMPQAKFIGVEADRRRFARARALPVLSNLEFRAGNAIHPPFEIGSLDAIVSAFLLHEIYSGSQYSEETLRTVLRMHMSLLRPGGLIFVQDHLCPSHDGFVLLELDEPTARGDEPSASENLLWYAEHAHPAQDPSSGGFYLEERPPRFPRTRLFRLPFKWAIEFLLRPGGRASLEESVHRELTCFTRSDFRKELRALGARVIYSAPHTDESVLRRKMTHCRLYAEDGTPMPPPATSFLSVLRKTEEGESTLIQERRPSKAPSGKLRICALRDENDGRIVDVAIPERRNTEILPWRLDENGRLLVFIHEGVPRGIVNAIPRLGAGLDGREWSGHMIEAIRVDESALRAAEAEGTRGIVSFCVNTLGLRPEIGQTPEPGPDFYPAPDFIDERISTRYLRVADQGVRSFAAPDALAGAPGGAERSRIREIDAQRILDAISVGFIPDARLEIQIQALFDRLGLKPVSWVKCPLTLNRVESLPLADLHAIEKALRPGLSGGKERFKPVKGTAGQLKVAHSVFVEEGRARGGITGLAAHDIDFVLPDDSTVNTAVVLPLATKVSGEVMAGVVTKYLPVPERYAGNGAILSVPSFTLPPDIRSIWQARKFIADQFDVGIEHVSKMGESYFSHTGLTPRRIYPFAVAVPIPSRYKVGYFQTGPMKPVQFAPLRGLFYMIWKALGETPLLKMIAQSYQIFGFDNDGVGVDTSFGFSLAEDKAAPVSAARMEFISDREEKDQPGGDAAKRPERMPMSLDKPPEQSEDRLWSPLPSRE